MAWKRILGLAFVVCLLGACNPRSDEPIEIYRFCESDSGQAKFYLHLDRAHSSGEMRYQFLGQDVLYRVTGLEAPAATIIGSATFDRSATGETRGSAIKFEYDYAADTFSDGLTLFHCVALQDVSLMNLPERN